MNLKTILGWLAVAFIVWFVIENPNSGEHVGTFLTTMASGLSHWFASI